jgi:hypothetical protein
MGGKPAKKQDLFDVSMDIKLASRQMANEAKKVERLEVSERKKVATVSYSFYFYFHSYLLSACRLFQKDN